MTRLIFALSILLVLVAVPAFAQAPNASLLRMQGSLSPGEVTPTPEMWFYEQYRRDYLDPRLAILQRAQFQSQQRQRRIAARKWFGLSNARPIANSDPFHGDYSPRWTSNDGHYPYRWSGSGQSWIVLRPQYYPTRTY